jgi:hypothetical protein
MSGCKLAKGRLQAQGNSGQACWMRREFPTVEHFVNDKAEDFDSLEVRYRFGSSPRLILNGENGKKETLRIDKWKTELIEEFLRDKLPANTAEL